jgi:hypothetical protein
MYTSGLPDGKEDDFSLNAQFQIIGNTAPLKNNRFRMRLTPGIVIPFPGIDDKDALGNHT